MSIGNQRAAHYGIGKLQICSKSVSVVHEVFDD